MSIDDPETEAHANLMGKIGTLSVAITAALQEHGAGLPLATVVGVLECAKMDAHLTLLRRYEENPS